jgi:hypothetical protein
MKPTMNEPMQEIIEWGLLHDAVPQAARICYELWATNRPISKKLPISRFYRSDEERGPILIWWNGREANKIEQQLPPGSITFTRNYLERNNVHYYETHSLIWNNGEWVEGPKEDFYITKGGIVTKPVVLDRREGIVRWTKGMTSPFQIGK